MNKGKTSNNWLGKAFTTPVSGSEQCNAGYAGAYGLIAISAASFDEGVSNLSRELLENGLILSGFEWVFNVDYIDRDLEEKEKILLSKLASYPVQFYDFHWFKA